jgi:hypothetical protein
VPEYDEGTVVEQLVQVQAHKPDTLLVHDGECTGDDDYTDKDCNDEDCWNVEEH